MPINEKDPRKNAERYPDPTAYQAIKNVTEEEERRFYLMIHLIKAMCDACDFEVGNRIVLIDKRTRREWH